MIALSAIPQPQVIHLGNPSHGNRGPERYYLEDLWSLHLYSNAFDLEVENKLYQIQPGDMTLMSPRQHMTFHYQYRDYRHFYCLFKLDIGEQLFSSAHYQLDKTRLDCCTHLFRSAVAGQFIDPIRCQTAIWEILWQLNTPDHSATNPHLNPVLRAQHLITSSLSKDLGVALIAQEVGLSGNQLTRLFNQQLGCTVIGYIRQERMKLAKRLIHDTDLPIKRIANDCGFSDLQYFNKTIRQFYNCSPRQLRS